MLRHPQVVLQRCLLKLPPQEFVILRGYFATYGNGAQTVAYLRCAAMHNPG